MPDPTPSLTDPKTALAGEAVAAQRAEAGIKSVTDETLAGVSDIRARTAAMKPPTLDALPAPPTPTYRSPVEAFGSVAGLLAVLGGSLTRAPLTASLNAAAGVLGAYRKQDEIAAEQQYQAWKVSTDNALKLHQFKLDEYRAAIEEAGQDTNALLAIMRAKASAFNDTFLMQSKTAEDVMANFREQQRLGIEASRASIDIQVKKLQLDNLMQDRQAADSLFQAGQKAWSEEHGGQAMPPDETLRWRASVYNPVAALRYQSRALGNPTEVVVKDENGKRTQVLAQQDHITGQWFSADEERRPLKGVEAMSGKEVPDANDPDVMSAARMISEYKMAPLSGWALRTPYGIKVMGIVKEMNPDYDATMFGERSKAVKDFATGKQGQQIQSFNVAIAHLNTLDRLTAALENQDVQAINRLSNYWKTQTGLAAPTNFEAAKQIVADEVVKAILTTGGGVTDRENARQVISAASSPSQLRGVTKTWRELMAGQLGGLRKTYEETTSLKNFDDRLLPETKEELSRASVGKSAGGGPLKIRPVPPAYRSKEDGTILYDENNFAYVKRGDTLELMQ